MNRVFDAEQIKQEIVEWIRDWFAENGPDCNAIIGISGGKDSAITATLCAEALGCERVIGVLMPNGSQNDIADSHMVCDILGIQKIVLPVTAGVSGIRKSLKSAGVALTYDARVNLPPRIRMATLYAAAQCLNGRVANTSNLSEAWVGYSTRYGDSAGDFCPLAKLTVREIKVIGHLCALPAELVDKTPSDGLCGRTDEDNLGFTYDVLDWYIRTGECENMAIKGRIDQMHQKNAFKRSMPESYDPHMMIKSE